MRKELKTDISLIILGNLLYLAYMYFSSGKSSPFWDFSSGFLVGLSIGCNLIGIILTVRYIAKNNKNDYKEKVYE